MKRWSKLIGVFVLSLMLMATQVTVALARGGGGVGGSLGGSVGRSFGGSFSGGGLSGGGYSGGLGRGFGGFFPMPFFFGGGYSMGGSAFGGLFSFLFVLLILYLVFKALRFRRGWSRRDTRKWGSPYTPSQESSGPVDLNGRPITNNANLQRFGKAINFTRQNMGYYAQTFPRWDREYMVGRVRQVFYWLQDAWSRQDLSAAPDHVAPELAAKYRADVQGMKERGERNLIKEPMLNPEDIEFIQSHLDEENQEFTVMISASLIDYTVDAAGRQISGDSQNRLYFVEFWKFVWKNEQWLLSAIYQEDSLEVARIARGDDE